MQKCDDIQKVIAAVIKKNGKFLIAKRAKKDTLQNKWEFPGGKVEPGETFDACLKREIFEELGIVIEVGEYICSSRFTYREKKMEMLAFYVTSFSGIIELKEHKEVRWIATNEFHLYEFPEPDLPIIEALKKEK